MALTAESVGQHDVVIGRRSAPEAHRLLGTRVGYAITTVAASRRAREGLTRRLDEMRSRYLPTDADFMLIDLGDRRDQILDVPRARGLRDREGGRWRCPLRSRSSHRRGGASRL
jgi:hypothetical protein